jgi:hypothetical protein
MDTITNPQTHTRGGNSDSPQTTNTPFSQATAHTPTSASSFTPYTICNRSPPLPDPENDNTIPPILLNFGPLLTTQQLAHYQFGHIDKTHLLTDYWDYLISSALVFMRNEVLPKSYNIEVDPEGPKWIELALKSIEREMRELEAGKMNNEIMRMFLKRMRGVQKLAEYRVEKRMPWGF